MIHNQGMETYDSSTSCPFGDSWYEYVPLVQRGETEAIALRLNRLTAYFFAPYYFMRAILGWQDCGNGVRQLFTGPDVPELDPLFGQWRRLGVLDILGLWAWTTGEQDIPRRNPARRPEGFCNATRLARINQLVDTFAYHGTDPLHLSGHIQTVERLLYESSVVKPDFIRSDVDRRIALFVDKFDEWPQALYSLGTLLSKPPPSWRVRVVSKRAGYLGEYRACWSCGRWFQGRAQFHQLGCSSPG